MFYTRPVSRFRCLMHCIVLYTCVALRNCQAICIFLNRCMACAQSCCYPPPLVYYNLLLVA